MPKTPVRNVDRFKVRGSHLNEFEFHKHQAEMAEEFEAPGAEGRAAKPRSQAERVAQLMADAKRIAEKRKKHDAKGNAGKKKIAAGNQMALNSAAKGKANKAQSSKPSKSAQKARKKSAK